MDIEKLYNAMLEKEELIPDTFTEFLEDLQCPSLSHGEVYVCDFLRVKSLPFNKDEDPVKLIVFAGLMQRIQEFISFYYNIYDNVIYLEMEV